MRTTTTINNQRIEITTEHPASSHGIPIVLVDGELTDVPVEHEPDYCHCTALDLLADAAGIHTGPRSRRALHELAAELYPDGPQTGAQCDRVIRTAQRRHHRTQADDADADLRDDLREAIRRTGHTQTQAADIVGVHPGTLNRFLNGAPAGRTTAAGVRRYIKQNS